MKKRILSFILCLVLIAGIFPFSVFNLAHAATTSQNNIVARANYLYSQTWTCQETVSGWRGNYTFTKGNTYRLPYGQPINSGKYIGYGVTMEEFLTAANTKGSVFYTSRSTYTSNGSSSVFYAIDCSAFVSWCWGIDRYTTYSLPQVASNLGSPTSSTVSNLQLGDALNSVAAGHVVLVTGLTYSGSTLTKIEITEQTPPQLKRSTYTPDQIITKYGSAYTILRYNGSVPAAPSSGSGSTGGTTDNTGKYFPPCASSYESIVNALNSIGVDSSKEYRTVIATFNGISNYTGTAAQNESMLKLLKSGLLLNPAYVPEEDEPSSVIKPVVYYPPCDPKYESIVNALNSLGVTSTKDYRTVIAKANGISDYSGTADQNNTLVTLLLEGKLIDPNPTANIGLYKYLPPCSSACDTIIEGLDEIGVASTKTYRTTIAELNGFVDYTGTYEQNVTMLDMLKAGKLRNPEYSGLSAPATYYPACSSTCTSIAAGLSDICVDNSQAWISEIASENGMLTYSGSAEEKTTLLNLLKSGKLINPDPSVSLMRNKYYPACNASAASLVAGLNDIGVESSYNYRVEIASANGILNYSDTSTQNTTLLNLLKSGRLIHARYPGFMDSNSVTNGNTGYDRGYKGGMEGTGWIAYHGLDISSYQGADLDFNRIKSAGYDYVILRAGTTNGKDTTFENNYTKAKAAGLDVGAYFYTYATTVSAAEKDANTFLSYLSGKKFEYPVYLDYEDETQQALSSTLSQRICLAFMNKLKAAGYLTGMYTGQYFAKQLPMSTICAEYEVWIAQYPKTGDDCTDDWKINGYEYADDYGMYQYASKVYINGTYGPYDGNVCYKEYPSIVKKYGFNGYASDCAHYYKATVTAPTCTNSGYTTYVCSSCGNSYTGNTVPPIGHSYLDGSCTACGTANLSTLTDFYLFGYINGADYACEADANNLGEYKFENGKLVATFTETSYVAIKAAGSTTWYMTDGWLGEEATSATLYSTGVLGDRANKLQVPGGVEVVFTLTINNNDTLTLSYTLCQHSYKKTVTTSPTCTVIGEATYTCTICGVSYTEVIDPVGHSYKSVVTAPTCTDKGYTKHTCNSCGYMYTSNEVAAAGHNYSTKVTAPTCTKTGYTTYTCKTCGYSYKGNETAVVAHSYTTKVTPPTCTSAGYTTYTCKNCSYSYQGNTTAATSHSYKAVVTPATCSAKGYTTYTCIYCNDSYTGNETAATGHTYTAVVTSATCTTAGYTTFTCTTCNHSYVSNQVAATGHRYKSVVTPPTCSTAGYTTFTCTTCGHSYRGNEVGVSDHSYRSVVTPPTCTAAGYTTYTCSHCGLSYKGNNVAATGHNFVNSTCTVCGYGDANYTPDYYLFGFINGANYGCEEDAQNMGQYLFADGQLTATFNSDSYVAVRTSGNAKWYMTNGWLGENANSAVLYDTTTEGLDANKLYVPGNVEVTFTLTQNNDGSLTLSYTTKAITASVVPTLTLKSPTLEFKDMITVNALYTAENTQDVVEMGMITYSTKVTSWSVATADHVIPGATYDEGTGRYVSSSQGIHAKYLGDTVYLAIYAKLKDGTYAYSKLAGYSPVQYAASQLKNSTDTKLKQLVVAMLNYGAEAQLYFGHNTAALANASLTAEQKALPEAYRSDMIKTVATPSTMKQGVFVNNSGYAKRMPSISFEGAFCINYFFTPKYVPDNGITLYYWNASAYNRAGVLTTTNATGTIKLEGSGTGEYRGDLTGIAAKALSDAVYVAAVYENGGTTWCSGVLGYSIGTYCSSQASKGSAIANLAMATTVYGYHAKQYFG